jgi:hypothetical protein
MGSSDNSSARTRGPNPTHQSPNVSRIGQTSNSSTCNSSRAQHPRILQQAGGHVSLLHTSQVHHNNHWLSRLLWMKANKSRMVPRDV